MTTKAKSTSKAGRSVNKVGTKILFENRRVRVWELVLRPGESSHRHLHLNDYVFVYTSGGTKLALYQDDDDVDPELSTTRVNHVEFTAVGSGVKHLVKNVGRKAHREILVEIKGPSRARRPKDPQTNDR